MIQQMNRYYPYMVIIQARNQR